MVGECTTSSPPQGVIGRTPSSRIESAPAEAAVSRVLFPGGRLRPPGGGHSSRTGIAAGLQRAYPEARPDQPPRGPCGSALCLPICSCSRRGLPCRRHCCRRGALLPHLFTLTGPVARPGGLFSVALSCGSPRPAVSRHPVLWSSDFPPVQPLASSHTSVRPPPPAEQAGSTSISAGWQTFRSACSRGVAGGWPETTLAEKGARAGQPAGAIVRM